MDSEMATKPLWEASWAAIGVPTCHSITVGHQRSTDRDSIARPAAAPSTATKTYVVDTSVLLSDPRALVRFAEHHVVLPIVVIIELEGKRHHPELGYFAREALRLLDDLRVAHGGLNEPVPVGHEGGTLRVELNSNDHRPLTHRGKIIEDTVTLSVR